MGTPASFKITEGRGKLTIERTHPSQSHLHVQGFSALGVVAFFIFGYLIGQLPAIQLLRIGIVLFPALMYIGLSLIFAPWRTKETLVLDKPSGLLTYSKIGKHPWLTIKKSGSIDTLPPFTVEYFYFPLKEITSVHSMTLDSVDEFEDYLVFYFKKVNVYMSFWEYSFDSTRVGYKAIESIAQFLGQQIGEEINKPSLVSFNLSFINDLISNLSPKQGLRIDSKQAFLSYDYKLAISAALSEIESYHRVKLKPDDAHAHLMVGLAYLGKGMRDNSIKYFQRSLHLFELQKDQRHVKRVKQYLRDLIAPSA